MDRAGPEAGTFTLDCTDIADRSARAEVANWAVLVVISDLADWSLKTLSVSEASG